MKNRRETMQRFNVSNTESEIGKARQTRADRDRLGKRIYCVMMGMKLQWYLEEKKKRRG